MRLIYLLLVIFISCKEGKRGEEYSVVNGDTIKTTYHLDSNYKTSISVIKGGLSNGLFKSYYNNGKPKATGLLENNKKVGLWLFFNKDSIVISAIHFHNDTIVRMLDERDFHFKREIYPNRLEISVPSMWKSDSSHFRNGLLNFYKPCEITFCPNFNISVQDISEQLTIDEFTTQYVQVLVEKLSRFTLVYTRKLTINGNDAIQVGISFIENETPLGGIMTLIKMQDRVVIMTGIARSADSNEFFLYKGLFEQIASTIKAN